MKSQPKSKRKLHIGSELRLLVYVWCLVVGSMLLFSMTYAWYSLNTRVAETQVPNVMKPYHLALQDSGGVATEQISIGSFQQGEKKQILFSVTNIEDPQKNKNTTGFDYALELIYTNNLALKYEVYQLVELSADEVDSEREKGTEVIVSEEIISGTEEENNIVTKTYYWKKTGSDTVPTALQGVNVSAERWVETNLTDTVDGADAATSDIVNRGTYISYTAEDLRLEVTKDENGQTATDAYATQYFLLEISWSIDSGYDQYEKETDMIYVVAKAVQPEPTVK